MITVQSFIISPSYKHGFRLSNRVSWSGHWQATEVSLSVLFHRRLRPGHISVALVKGSATPPPKGGEEPWLRRSDYHPWIFEELFRKSMSHIKMGNWQETRLFVSNYSDANSERTLFREYSMVWIENVRRMCSGWFGTCGRCQSWWAISTQFDTSGAVLLLFVASAHSLFSFSIYSYALCALLIVLLLL